MSPIFSLGLLASVAAMSTVLAPLLEDNNSEGNNFKTYKTMNCKDGTVSLTKHIKTNHRLNELGVLFVGPPSIGKTARFLKPLISSLENESAVITDPSGCLKDMVDIKDHKVYVFNPFDLDKTIGWNPFKTSQDIDELRSLLKNLLESGYTAHDTNHSSANSKEWLSISETLLMSYATFNYATQKYNLAEFINNLLTKPIFCSPDWYVANPSSYHKQKRDELIKRNELTKAKIKELTLKPNKTKEDLKLLKELKPLTDSELQKLILQPPIDKDSIEYEILKSGNKQAITEFKTLTQSRSINTQLFISIRTVLTASFKIFSISKVKSFCEKPSFDFQELRNKNTFLFVEIPALYTEEYKPLVSTFILQIIKQLFSDDCTYEATSKVKPVYLVLDEFGNIGKLPNFDQTCTQSRKYHVPIVITIQSILQLYNVYGEYTGGVILENLQTKIVSSGLESSAEYFSKLLGNTQVKKDDNIITKPLLTPEELRCMDRDSVVVISQSKLPVKDVLNNF